MYSRGEARNPNWVSGSTLFSIMMGSIRLRINISSILAKNGKRLIGRWDDSNSGGFFGLGTNIIVENLDKRLKW